VGRPPFGPRVEGRRGGDRRRVLRARDRGPARRTLDERHRPGDPEGFSAASGQFDSDITAGRHPRAALALTRRGRLLAVAADGRGPDDAGLRLDELAEALVARGAVQAINLDGGGSTSLVSGGTLRNDPREGGGAPIPGGRPVTTALIFTAR
jgi:phosphodiester glycosidase